MLQTVLVKLVRIRDSFVKKQVAKTFERVRLAPTFDSEIYRRPGFGQLAFVPKSREVAKV